MIKLRLRAAPRLVRRGAVVLVVTALSMTGATAASANEPGDDRDPREEAGHADVLAAVQRDLGLSPDEAERLIADSAAATALDAELRAELGDAVSGSWFDDESGQLVVDVTDADAARLAREQGARSQIVPQGSPQLDTVVEALDDRVQSDPDAYGDIYEWYVDPASDQVIVTVDQGQADVVTELLEEYGDAVHIEESDAGPPELSHHGGSGMWLDGGINYNSCSIGFNVRNQSTGDRYFLTAGHCGNANDPVSSHGTSVGHFVESWFPGPDDAIVAVTNSSWNQGPWVWTYGQLNGTLIVVRDWVDPPTNTVICKSGATTQLTCGVLDAKGVTVNYPQGQVFGMHRHTACHDFGDSGGSTFTPGPNSTYLAVGIHSGGIQSSSCPVTSLNHTAYYYPMSSTMPYYAGQYGVTLNW